MTHKEQCEKWLGFEITDEWFLKYNVHLLTENFCKWWVKYYDTPEKNSYLDIDYELDEYYARMAFAMKGWNARDLSLGATQMTHEYNGGGETCPNL